MIMIAYASKYGTSEEVAKRIAESLQKKSGKEVAGNPIAEIADLGEREAVIVVSRLYDGGSLADAIAFGRNNAAALSRIATRLFSVGQLGTELKDDEEQPFELAEFREKIGQSHHTVFHGALSHSKLDRRDRMTMKAAGAREGDFRDWDAIAAWVDTVAKSVGRAAT